MPFESPRPEPALENEHVGYRHEQIVNALTERPNLERLLVESQTALEGEEKQLATERLATGIAAELITSIQALGLPDRSGEIQIRDEQIAGIAALLEGVSLQAPTGSGKTSVIIPIAALASAIASEKPIIVETVSPELVDSLKAQIAALAKRLPSEIKERVSILGLADPTPTEESSKSDQFTALSRALITSNVTASHLEIPEDLAAQQAKQLFTKFLSPASKQFVDVQTGERIDTLPNGPTVIVAQEGASRFFTMRNRGIVGTVIADEADVPFNRNSEYVTTVEPGVITPEAVETYCTDRVLAGVVAMLIDGASDDPDSIFDALADLDSPEFRAATHHVTASLATHLGVEPNQLEDWFRHRIVSARTAQMSEGGSLQDVFSAHYLAALQAKELSEGSHYSLSETDNPTVRDHFMGLQLPSHQFQYQLTLALQAQHEAFEYQAPDVAETDASSFQGAIVNALNGRYVGLSGTFFSRELASEKIVPGSFAHFVERATDKEPVYFATEKQKAVPIPIVTSGENADQLFSAETSDPRQTLVACFNETDGRNMQVKLAETHPDRPCFLISDTLSDSEVAALLQEFADTPGAFLISTGRIGVGVNILTSEGAHTDHKTILYGIPFSQSQVFQALGRRRLENDPNSDASWIIDQKTLGRHPYIQALEKHQSERFEKELATQPLRAIDNLIQRGVESSRVSDEKHLQVDRAHAIARTQFEQKIQTRIPGLIEDLFRDDTLGRDLLSRFLGDIRRTDVETYVRSMLGCPSGLYWQVKRQLSGYAGYGSSAYDRLVGSLDTTVANDSAVDEWIETKRDEIGYILNKVMLDTLREAMIPDMDPETCRFTAYVTLPTASYAAPDGAARVPITDAKTGQSTECFIVMNIDGNDLLLSKDDVKRFSPLNVDVGPLSLALFYPDNPDDLDTATQK